MKTSTLLVMSALLLAAAGPVFAWTNPDQLACELAQVNCPVDTHRLEPRGAAVNSGSWSKDQFVCELVQVNCPTKTKVR